jgi:hypothetical protein
MSRPTASTSSGVERLGSTKVVTQGAECGRLQSWKYCGLMPTPVGPAPRDPNDPDFWDWEDHDDEPSIRRHPALAAVAAVVIVALVLLVVLSQF